MAIGKWTKLGALAGTALIPIPGAGTAIGAGLGYMADNNPGGPGTHGKYKMFGPTEEQIQAQLGASREYTDTQSDEMRQRMMRGMVNSAGARGMGRSGAIPMGTASVGRDVDQFRLGREAQLMMLANQMRNSRQYVYQPGFMEQFIPGAMSMGGQLGGAALMGGV